MNEYKDEFYIDRHENTIYSADKILRIIKDFLPSFNSVIDVGCGIGTWLYSAAKNGAERTTGIDGPWVNRSYLKINENNFIISNFANEPKPIINSKYDLAISLEVAEHLPASTAEDFITYLTSLSDFILFSAAIPNQGGVGHQNEQWPDYWINLFDKKGYYCIDIIRKLIWNDEEIPFWYRQNILFYIKKERTLEVSTLNRLELNIPPETYLLYLRTRLLNNPIAIENKTPGIMSSVKLLKGALLRTVLRKFNK
jgi:SAM-dependent methyltransferase